MEGWLSKSTREKLAFKRKERKLATAPIKRKGSEDLCFLGRGWLFLLGFERENL